MVRHINKQCRHIYDIDLNRIANYILQYELGIFALQKENNACVFPKLTYVYNILRSRLHCPIEGEISFFQS